MYICIVFIETPCSTSAIGLAQRSPRKWRLHRKYYFDILFSGFFKSNSIYFFNSIMYLRIQCMSNNIVCKFFQPIKSRKNISAFLVFMQTHQQSIKFAIYLQIFYKNRTFFLVYR